MTIDSITREALIEKLKQYPTLLQQFIVLLDNQGTILDNIQEILKICEEAEKISNQVKQEFSALSEETNQLNKETKQTSAEMKEEFSTLSEETNQLNEETKQMSAEMKQEFSTLSEETKQTSAEVKSKVSLSGDESISGTKIFTSPIKTNEIDDTNGNAMVCYKENENKIVVGNATTPTTIVGNNEIILSNQNNTVSLTAKGFTYNGKNISTGDSGEASSLYLHNLEIGTLNSHDMYNCNISVVSTSSQEIVTLEDFSRLLLKGEIICMVPIKVSSEFNNMGIFLNYYYDEYDTSYNIKFCICEITTSGNVIHTDFYLNNIANDTVTKI